MKFTPIINEIYRIAFGQRKFAQANALNEFTKSFQKQVWLLIMISLIVLSLFISIKSCLSAKGNFFSAFKTSFFYLIGIFLMNNSGKKYLIKD